MLSILCVARPALGETVKERLARLYGPHKSYSYREARVIMYNEVDCSNNKINLVYGSSTYNWKCGGKTIPPDKDVNAEHTVPQSFFDSKVPMVSDLHHLFSAPKTLNGARSNYEFAEFPYSDCLKFCKDNECTTTTPSNPDQYSCLHKSKSKWMPVKKDRGQVARAIFYFFTIYGEKYCPISKLGDVQTFKRWNNQYPPSDFEIARNNIVNKTQGNRNPYIDNNKLVDQAF